MQPGPHDGYGGDAIDVLGMRAWLPSKMGIGSAMSLPVFFDATRQSASFASAGGSRKGIVFGILTRRSLDLPSGSAITRRCVPPCSSSHCFPSWLLSRGLRRKRSTTAAFRWVSAP